MAINKGCVRHRWGKITPAVMLIQLSYNYYDQWQLWSTVKWFLSDFERRVRQFFCFFYIIRCFVMALIKGFDRLAWLSHPLCRMEPFYNCMTRRCVKCDTDQICKIMRGTVRPWAIANGMVFSFNITFFERKLLLDICNSVWLVLQVVSVMRWVHVEQLCIPKIVKSISAIF